MEGGRRSEECGRRQNEATYIYIYVSSHILNENKRWEGMDLGLPIPARSHSWREVS